MMSDLINAVASWPTLLLVLAVFGFAPGVLLRVIVVAFKRGDPRRVELLSELRAVPRWERPLWVAEQLEVALFEGFGPRLRIGVGALPLWLAGIDWEVTRTLSFDRQRIKALGFMCGLASLLAALATFTALQATGANRIWSALGAGLVGLIALSVHRKLTIWPSSGSSLQRLRILLMHVAYAVVFVCMTAPLELLFLWRPESVGQNSARAGIYEQLQVVQVLSERYPALPLSFAAQELLLMASIFLLRGLIYRSYKLDLAYEAACAALDRIGAEASRIHEADRG